MIISHAKIVAFQAIIIHCLLIFYSVRKGCSLYNEQNNTYVLGNARFISRVKHDISLAVSRSTLEINLVFPRTHACIILSIYICFDG